MNDMTEFQFDVWDLELTDEEVAEIWADLLDDEGEAGTWEGVDFPSPW